MLRYISDWPGVCKSYWVLAILIVWKLALAFVFVLPPPANDAFFFDGAVVNWLLHDKYINPSIGVSFPTSATEFFCAYPPGYQAILVVWMSVFGPSVEASLALHCVLLIAYAVTAVVFIRRIGVPAAEANIGSAFFFGLTFHDRPDSVAHLFGLLSVLCWMSPVPGRQGVGRTTGAVLAFLALATSLHIGAMYSAMLWGYSAMRFKSDGWPWGPACLMVLLPIGFATGIIVFSPTAWRGFQENLLATASFTAFRFPSGYDVLKVIRNVPGLLIVTAFLAGDLARGRRIFRSDLSNSHVVPVFIAILAAADYCAVASLFVVGTNYVWAAAYPQPLIVALWLMARASSHHKPPESKNRLSFAVLAVAIAIFSIRAVALTTWGVISSIDFGKSSASREIRRVLDGLPDGAEIIVSSPYLYDLAGQQRLKTFHADWIGPYGEPGRVNPAVMVLTPYDYFRRFESELKEKDRRHHIARWEVLTMQRVPVPDQFPAYQRLVQHISWAPVIVQVEWR